MEYTLLTTAHQLDLLKRQLLDAESKHYTESVTVALATALGDSQQGAAAVERMNKYARLCHELRAMIEGAQP